MAGDATPDRAAGKIVHSVVDDDKAPNSIRVEFTDGTALRFFGCWCNDSTADVSCEWDDDA